MSSNNDSLKSRLRAFVRDMRDTYSLYVLVDMFLVYSLSWIYLLISNLPNWGWGG